MKRKANGDLAKEQDARSKNAESLDRTVQDTLASIPQQKKVCGFIYVLSISADHPHPPSPAPTPT